MFTDERFADRVQAGRKLAAALDKVALVRPVVYGLPRGGVPVAAVVAAALQAPLDLVLVRKIGAPYQPELGVGAVVDGSSPEVLIDHALARETGADAAYLAATQASALREIERRRAVYLRGRAPIDCTGRDAVVVDDGIATGSTMLVAVRALKRRGARRVVVAIPVAPPDTVGKLEAEADEVVCLLTPAWFGGVGAFYRDFHQLEDDEVVALMDAADERLRGQEGV